MAARMSVYDLGARRTVAKARVRHGGVLRELKTVKVMHGNALRLVASFIQPLVVAASNTGNFPGYGPTTRPSTTTVTGGLPPFSYSWAILTGSATINTPSASSTSFTKPDFVHGDEVIARVTVTDGAGSQAQATMTASWRTDPGGA